MWFITHVYISSYFLRMISLLHLFRLFIYYPWDVYYMHLNYIFITYETQILLKPTLLNISLIYYSHWLLILIYSTRNRLLVWHLLLLVWNEFRYLCLQVRYRKLTSSHQLIFVWKRKLGILSIPWWDPNTVRFPHFVKLLYWVVCFIKSKKVLRFDQSSAEKNLNRKKWIMDFWYFSVSRLYTIYITLAPG